mgnify:CR=1 FL=1
MNRGDLIRYKDSFVRYTHAGLDRVFIVRWVEPENNWVCVFGIEPPLQIDMMEVVSESR